MTEQPERPDPPLEFRELSHAEFPMVVRYWLEYLGQQRPWLDCDRNWYCASQRALIDRLLTRSGVVAIGAHVPDEPDEILGYVVGDPSRRILHWVYVKNSYRRLHVATRLLGHVYGEHDEQIIASIRTRALEHHASAWNVRIDTYALGEAA